MIIEKGQTPCVETVNKIIPILYTNNKFFETYFNVT